MNTRLLMTLCVLSGGMLGAVILGRCWVGLATLSWPILKPFLTAPVPGLTGVTIHPHCFIIGIVCSMSSVLSIYRCVIPSVSHLCPTSQDTSGCSGHLVKVQALPGSLVHSGTYDWLFGDSMSHCLGEGNLIDNG